MSGSVESALPDSMLLTEIGGYQVADQITSQQSIGLTGLDNCDDSLNLPRLTDHDSTKLSQRLHSMTIISREQLTRVLQLRAADAAP